jgi:hypothetical protein
MINKYNLSDLNLVDRPIDARREGFGSILPQHNRQHKQRYFSTEYRSFFGEPRAEADTDKLA